MPIDTSVLEKTLAEHKAYDCAIIHIGFEKSYLVKIYYYPGLRKFNSAIEKISKSVYDGI